MKYNYKTTECRKAYTRVPVYVSNMVHFSVHLPGLYHLWKLSTESFIPTRVNWKIGDESIPTVEPCAIINLNGFWTYLLTLD